jgi:hypothetical protein
VYIVCKIPLASGNSMEQRLTPLGLVAVGRLAMVWCIGGDRSLLEW